MTLAQLKAFLWQCTKLNFFVLLLFSLVLLFFADQVFALHQHFYGGTLVAFKRDLYLVMGVYKMLWIFFNGIPYWVVRNIEKVA